MTERSIRVLVEHPSPLVRLDLVEELDAAGFDVVACGGPTQRPCSLVVEGSCAEASRADVIVNALGGAHLDVYLAQRTVLSDTPVCLEASPQRLERLREVLGDVRPTGPIPAGSSLVERIHEALERR